MVTGGGASPNGVKAFVTQYSGLQDGQVDKRCEKSLAFLGSKEASVEGVESGELDRTEDNQVESDKDQGDKPH